MVVQQRNRLRVVVASGGRIAAQHYAIDAVVPERRTKPYVHVARPEPTPRAQALRKR